VRKIHSDVLMARGSCLLAASIKTKDGGPDEEVGYGVAKPLPVIVWDREQQKRVIVPMRWGFPHAKDWRRTQPIHARSETIDTTKAFAHVFADGQRGIVVFKTFNEGEETLTSGGKPKTIQWTIDPQDGIPRGFAFVWKRFEIAGLSAPMLACVMATVPASKLVRTIMANQEDPRMPAILEDADWDTWLGQKDATPEQVKAVLKTMEGVNWKIEKEQRAPKPRSSGKNAQEDVSLL
jgi:putative SOS response-associated peptidase YedK